MSQIELPHRAPKPLMLLILDGFGYREASAHNAIAQAQCPNWRRIWQQYPRTLIRTDGLAVGLPEGQMGNSEVGHMNLGAGRVVFQELTRINLEIQSGAFFANSALLLACDRARAQCLHMLILLSDGGVHSHEEHLFAALDLAVQQQVKSVALHLFLDGRDTPPRSAELYLARLRAKLDTLAASSTLIRIHSVCGRYFAMDRDRRWERVASAWHCIVDSQAAFYADSAEQALAMAYARGENDEFVQATCIKGAAAMADGDAVLFLNFRADRARALTQCFTEAQFGGFARARFPALSAYVTLTEYAKSLPVSAIAYLPQSMQDTLPEVLTARGLTQLRIAETEKYAHVTFFFNAGVEAPYPGEARILVPSPKVATYDLQPEMSCPQVTAHLVEAIRAQRFDVIICNIANPDMVGHTGILSAAIQAVEAVDTALGAIESAILDVGGSVLITADHGNLEEMWNSVANQPDTQHSMNPVPAVLIGSARRFAREGTLSDIAPTLLELLGIAKPAAMSGSSLLA
jgi:2,3-bisphosphoglycerate-independent phosphoglycerate mutase